MSYPTYSDLELEIQNLEEENRKLKEVFREEIPRPYSSFINELEEENRKMKEERDFFKEQAILWRKDYKNEYEKNRKLEERVEELEKEIEELNKMMLFETKI